MRSVHRQQFTRDAGAWTASMGQTEPEMVMIGCGSCSRVLKDMICPQLPLGPVHLQALSSLGRENSTSVVPQICRFATEIRQVEDLSGQPLECCILPILAITWPLSG